MEINKVGIFVSLFVMLIVGLVLLGTTTNTTNVATEQNAYVANDSITLINGTAVNLVNDWVNSITIITLGNGTELTTATTNDCNYTVDNLASDDIATITLHETTTSCTGNTSNVAYTYQDDNYIRNATSRVFIRLILIFFGIAILLMAVWGMYQMGIGEVLKRK